MGEGLPHRIAKELGPTLRVALLAIQDDWARPTGRLTRRLLDSLERRKLYEFRQITDPDHSNPSFRPGLIGQLRLTPLGKEVRDLLARPTPSKDNALGDAQDRMGDDPHSA